MPPFLIVDDSRGKIQFLSSMLERAHWQGPILQALTTEDAKDMIDTHPDIAAAFIDYYIPSQCGPAVITYLTKKIPSARIALVSSADNQENAAEARAAGAEAVVCSSAPIDVVDRQLRELIDAWRTNA